MPTPQTPFTPDLFCPPSAIPSPHQVFASCSPAEVLFLFLFFFPSFFWPGDWRLSGPKVFSPFAPVSTTFHPFTPFLPFRHFDSRAFVRLPRFLVMTFLVPLSIASRLLRWALLTQTTSPLLDPPISPSHSTQTRSSCGQPVCRSLYPVYLW